MAIKQLGALGLCEHCGELLTMQDMPSEAIDAKWACPSCEGILSYKSFGYESSAGYKVQWVGPNREWTSERPTKDFELGDWDIVIGSSLPPPTGWG